MGQGARVSSVLYDEPLPPVRPRPGTAGRPASIPSRAWEQVRQRADAVPADLVPGLLGTTLRAGGVGARAPVSGPGGAIVAYEGGRVRAGRCRPRACPAGAL